MTAISERLGGQSDGDAVVEAPPAAPTSPVLVTEQQVMLASAIAVSTSASRRRMRPFQALAHGLHRVVTWSPDVPRRNHDNARRTPSWYSDALMAREMYRL